MATTTSLDATRRAKGRKLAAALDKACLAMNEYIRACNECDDASAVQRADDGRLLLREKMREFEGYLTTVYGEG